VKRFAFLIFLFFSLCAAAAHAQWEQPNWSAGTGWEQPPSASSQPNICDTYIDFENGSISPSIPITSTELSNATHNTSAGAGIFTRHYDSTTGGTYTSLFIYGQTLALPHSISVNGTTYIPGNGTRALYEDLGGEVYLNSQCTGSGLGPSGATWPLCTGVGTGTYLSINNINFAGANTGCTAAGVPAWGDKSNCTANGNPWTRCTGNDTCPTCNDCCKGSNNGNCGSWNGVVTSQNCIAAGNPWMCCTGPDTGTCNGSDNSYFAFTTMPPNGLVMDATVLFNMTGAGENGYNLPLIGIKQSTTTSWCNFNVYIANAGGSGSYVRTESSPATSIASYGATTINMSNNYEYRISMAYFQGPASPSSVYPNNLCTGSGTCSFGNANMCSCCTGNGVGTCGVCEINVYDPQNSFAQVGSTSFGSISNNATAIQISLGKDGNGNSPMSGGYVTIDDVAVQIANPSFPMFP
jgi:hypothetical protein